MSREKVPFPSTRAAVADGKMGWMLADVYDGLAIHVSGRKCAVLSVN